MYEVRLINLPFASVQRPSIALTQLQWVVEQTCRDAVSVDLFYLNQDFAHYMGIELYQEIADGKHYNLGLGDWFFRQIAFPELADNAKEYFLRYYPQQNKHDLKFKWLLLEKRRGLDRYLDELITLYRLDQADLVGFTTMFAQNVACFKPGIVIVLGGANCEPPMGQEIIRHIPSIDFVFSGPGLNNFPQFVLHQINQTGEACYSIPGIYSKRGAELRPSLVNLLPRGKHEQGNLDQTIGKELEIDSEIELDYQGFLDTFERHFPHQEVEPVLLFETSRGCWWGERAHCTFCGLNGLTLNYRSMNAKNAIQIIQSLFKYSDRCRSFECVDNILPRNYIKDVFPLLNTPPDTFLFYEVKSSLNEDDMRQLSEAGVKTIQPGIEALATSTLQIMKKGSTSFQNLLLLKNSVLHDILPIWNILVGFPGEDESVYKKYVADFPLLTHLPPSNGVMPIRFDRYSPYFIQKEYLAYYFTDHNFTAEYRRNVANWLSKMEKQQNIWWQLWYGENSSTPPKLFFKERTASDTTIFDSRSGKAVEHHVTLFGGQILEFFQKPGRIADLTTHLGHVQDFDPIKELVALQNLGLLFQDGEKFLSLVLPHDTLPITTYLRIRHKKKEQYDRAHIQQARNMRPSTSIVS